ncbi:hypothetical protein HOLleu_41933 [Holothuria leucospilota]|uniref:Uncharacterized protein n=1 Tax=Holothuria leucospilota TaxID=206669 RepID=A0A9Q0YJU9_HOLLE|nr:hypothetical protein HOLleu_41933 [Holothuria leucospilota]
MIPVQCTTSPARLVTTTLTSVSNSPTVFCNVSGDVQGSAQLTIRTISRNLSPYCVSDFTDGIIANAAIKLSCYIDTQRPAGLLEQWRDNNDMTLVLEERNIFGNTRRISTTVVVGTTNNGTNYTCVEVRDGMISASCQVGPIFVYENVLPFIEIPDMRNLSHGDTREFRCSSVPSSNITWTVLEPGNDAGIFVSIKGPLITVTVPNNVKFVGSFRALCLGNLNDKQGVAILDLYITESRDLLSTSVHVTEANSTVATLTTEASRNLLSTTVHRQEANSTVTSLKTKASRDLLSTTVNRQEAKSAVATLTTKASGDSLSTTVDRQGAKSTVATLTTKTAVTTEDTILVVVILAAVGVFVVTLIVLFLAVLLLQKKKKK